MLASAGLFELRGSRLELLKSASNAENFIRRLFRFIASQFTLKMCVAARNYEKFTKTSNFGDSESFKVINVNKAKKPVTSACYDKQHVCTYLQPFSHQTSLLFFACFALRQVPMTMTPFNPALCSSLQFLVTDLLFLSLHK